MRWTALLAVAGVACAAGPAAEAGPAPTAQDLSVASAEQVRVCPGLLHVSVQSAEISDAEAVCDGAARALAFLARAGLDSPPITRIDIVSELPGDLAGRAVGCYMRETTRILLLSYVAFEAGGGWFRMPPSRELYRAAASHEVAHAVVGCQSELRRLPVAAHEYVAYVVFFATMDPHLRSALLTRFPGPGFQSAVQISDISHIVNPNQFAVDSWKHYLRVRDPAQWLRKVIAGEVVPELADDPGASTR